MPSLQYLDAQLRQLYSQAALSGERVADKYVLVIAETERSARLPVVEARLVALHIALRYAFVQDEPFVTIPPHRVVALAATDEPGLSDSLARLRSELKIAIAENRLPTARCRCQSLPRDPVELSLILLEIDA